MLNSKIFVIVPCYNEEECITETLQTLRKEMPTVRIVAVNDGSSDRTLEKLQCFNDSNLTILDIREVFIGDNVMIGPNTLITTVGHPLTPMKRRNHIGIAKPVKIGDDVWIGGNVTILPGVNIGNNVVIAAGAVVTKNVPDNTLVGGVPAKVIRKLENDIAESENDNGNDETI